MKKALFLTFIALFVMVVGMTSLFSINISSALVGEWIRCEDSNQHLEFQTNGRYHAVFEHSLGWIDTYGSFEVDESVNPHEVYYTISTIYIDGSQGRVGPAPGDEISGIWKINGSELTIFINDDPWGDPPSDFSDGSCYNKQ